MTTSTSQPGPAITEGPPIEGMSPEVWTWLRESMAVRPHVVAEVRAALASGEQASADEVALAILGLPKRAVRYPS